MKTYWQECRFLPVCSDKCSSTKHFINTKAIYTAVTPSRRLAVSHCIQKSDTYHSFSWICSTPQSYPEKSCSLDWNVFCCYYLTASQKWNFIQSSNTKGQILEMYTFPLKIYFWGKDIEFWPFAVFPYRPRIPLFNFLSFNSHIPFCSYTLKKYLKASYSMSTVTVQAEWAYPD